MKSEGGRDPGISREGTQRAQRAWENTAEILLVSAFHAFFRGHFSAGLRGPLLGIACGDAFVNRGKEVLFANLLSQASSFQELSQG